MVSKCFINNTTYTLHINEYSNDKTYADALDNLTQEVFCIDFKYFYTNNYFNRNKYHLYSLSIDNKVVSHITAITQVVEYTINTTLHYQTLLQISTLCTLPSFREKGLAGYLLDKVISDFKNNDCELFLFTNDNTLDFYSKKNFKSIVEYKASRSTLSLNRLATLQYRLLNLTTDKDLEIFKSCLPNNNPLHTFRFLNNEPLDLFYCHSLHAFKNRIYYFDKLQTVIITEINNNTLKVIDIKSKKADINIYTQALATIASNSSTDIELMFIPQQTDGWIISEFKDDDSSLMVFDKSKSKFLTSNKLMIPVLSRI